jgi:hypothetical protein
MHILNYSYSFLAKRGVKDEICSFDARKITPEIRASVQELLDKNANSFDAKVLVDLTHFNRNYQRPGNSIYGLIFAM